MKKILYFTLLLFFTSCIDNKIIVTSIKQHKPLPKPDVRHYKSVQEREGQDKNLTIGMSVSGGGSRAQYFGLGVLMGLEDIQTNGKNLLDEIDYFSTVSGGGFAIGYYLSLKKHGVLNDYSSFKDFWASKDRKENLQEFLYHSARTRTIIYYPFYERNLIRRPLVNRIDGQILQNRKEYKSSKFDTLFLRDFFIPKSSGEKITLPMFVTNGTIYNNAERLPFMPHILDSLKLTSSLSPKEPLEIDAGYGMPLKYAIAGSAAFPGILPMVKFKIKDSNSTLRIVDGGVVDNLGYMTLFEMLKTDPNHIENKKMIIVDCSGIGIDIRTIEDKHVSASDLISKALLYVVDVGQVNSQDGINYMASDEIESGNILRIGFLTLRNQLNYLKLRMNDDEKNKLSKLEKSIITKKDNWFDVYNKLIESSPFKDYKGKYSEIPTERFKELGLLEVFMLYELSSQVETKIKIYDEERHVLILAGRYSVYLEQEKMSNLLSTHTNEFGKIDNN